MQLRLAKLRENNGFTKAYMANILGVSKTSYTLWENGDRIIPTKRLLELANFWEVNLDYLVGLTNFKISRKNNSNNINLKMVGIHLKEVRNELNYTVRDVENELHIPHSRWSNYETGKTLITSWILFHMCKKSGISVDYIFERSKLKYLKDLQ